MLTDEQVAGMGIDELVLRGENIEAHCRALESAIAPLAVALEQVQADAAKIHARFQQIHRARLEAEDRSGTLLRVYEGDNNERNVAFGEKRHKRQVFERIEIASGGDERVIRTHEYGTRLSRFWDLDGNEKFGYGNTHLHPDDLASVLVEAKA